MRWTTPLRPLARAGDTLLDRALCVLGAVLLCQLPEFIQRYLQRLGGSLDEARRQLAQFTEVAALSRLTLAEFIERTGRTADASVARLAGVMRDAVFRVDTLAAAAAAIRGASRWRKPFVFFRHLAIPSHFDTLKMCRDGFRHSGFRVSTALVL